MDREDHSSVRALISDICMGYFSSIYEVCEGEYNVWILQGMLFIFWPLLKVLALKSWTLWRCYLHCWVQIQLHKWIDDRLIAFGQTWQGVCTGKFIELMCLRELWQVKIWWCIYLFNVKGHAHIHSTLELESPWLGRVHFPQTDFPHFSHNDGIQSQLINPQVNRQSLH